MKMKSSSQRHVISQLVATRNIIKKKFKRAYENRITREREAREVFKPILSSIDTLSRKKKKKDREPPENVGLEANRVQHGTPIRIYRHQLRPASAKKRTPTLDDTVNQVASKTPIGSLIVTSPRLTRSMSKKKRQLLFEDIVSKSSKRYRVSDTPAAKILQSPRSTRSQKRSNRLLKGGIDESRFEYEVVGDNQNVESYQKPPNDRSPISLKEISKLTKKTKLIKVEWRHLPEYAKLKWLQHRKKILQGYGKINDMEIDLSHHPVNRKGYKRKKINDSYQESVKKKRENDEDMDVIESESDVSMDDSEGAAAIDGGGMKPPLDFNFIPYNVNNRIVYEYFDDPNELCDRLRLLVSSKMGGNSNHMQEINSIIEELRELGCIV